VNPSAAGRAGVRLLGAHTAAAPAAPHAPGIPQHSCSPAPARPAVPGL